MFIWIIGFFGIIVNGILWGYLTQWVISARKHYNENWFWWGFFFGVFAFVAALIKPENVWDDHGTQSYHPALINNPPREIEYYADGWTCKRCNKSNPKTSLFCSCGYSKYENDLIVETEKTPAKDAEDLLYERVNAANKARRLYDTDKINEDEYKALKNKLYEI